MFFRRADGIAKQSKPGPDALGMRLCAAVSGLKIRSQGHPQSSVGKAVVGRCKVGPDALVELRIDAHLARFHPIASLGFLAEQGPSPLRAFAQTNSLSFELLADLQGGADGQIPRLDIQIGHQFEVHGIRNFQAVVH